ncbi:MAG: hypothetical protein LBO05_05190 [Deltaproteobacteria bacterium]|jgi:hypothetical protein|nr:hypothetical protein [Deltaproteobacteria bacterium]
MENKSPKTVKENRNDSAKTVLEKETDRRATVLEREESNRGQIRRDNQAAATQARPASCPLLETCLPKNYRQQEPKLTCQSFPDDTIKAIFFTKISKKI